MAVGFEPTRPTCPRPGASAFCRFGCSEPAHSNGFWKGGETCAAGASHILYAWARNDYILIFHYAQPFAGDVKDFSGVTLHMTQKQPQNFAAGSLIPPGRNQVQSKVLFDFLNFFGAEGLHLFFLQINMSCEYDQTTELHPFAFRTHTHAMGRVVSAYYKHEGQWTKIGARNPQWPQLFEMIPTNPVIRKGDLMAATCRFDSHDKTKPVAMGSMGINEMCNFYMMFYWDASKENPFPWGAVCGGQERMNEMRAEYPKEGTQLLPSRPDLEHHAAQSKVRCIHLLF
ncbi:copper type II ascorbate-dependent monooxygenase domain protein [Cooperia oncophora]